MPTPTILPDPTQVHLLGFTTTSTSITARVVATADQAYCPLCGHPSRRVHSRYVRRVSDLPWHGVALQLELHVQRFFCDQLDCPRQIFTQRLPGVVQPYARRTERLQAWFTAVGYAAGGEAGARLLRALGLAGSPDTLLRTLRHALVPARATPRVLSVDDWSIRRGQRYGTILVDLERHCPVDLLPDRSAEALARWLRDHPGVEIICRDRGGAYAEGARAGAPDAIQVADRWHLLHNVVETLERVLAREHAALQQAAAAVTAQAELPELPELLGASRTASPPSPEADPPSAAPTAPEAPSEAAAAPAQVPATTRRERERVDHRARRHATYDAVLRLHRAGVPLCQIAREVGVHRNTVRRFVRVGSYPERQPRSSRPSLLAPFEAYLRERWNGGAQNGQQLLAEIKTRGYRGSSSILYSLLAQWRTGPRRRGPASHQPTAAPPRRFTGAPRQTAWLLIRADDDREPDEQAYLDKLRDCPPVAAAAQLVTTFFALVRGRHADQLEAWLQAAEASGLTELAGFAQGVRRDQAAVEAGLTLDWNQGQTEGQVNRLKLLKRAMYGRAQFDLLRQRVLHRTAS